MNRWTVFDDAAAAAARERGGQVDVRRGDDAGPAVSEALDQQARVVAVFPAREPGKAVVLRSRRSASEPAVAASPSPAVAATPEALAAKPPSKLEPKVSYAAGGFLGLSDELVLDEEPPKPKKWWQKILD